MSTKRSNQDWWDPKQHPGASGRPLCRTCWTYHQRETEIPRGRLVHCSTACADEFLRRNNAGWARELVFKRDRGVCTRCGLDTEAFRRAARDWRFAAERAGHRPPWRKRPLPAQPGDGMRAVLWASFSRQRYVRGDWRTVFGVYGFPADGSYSAAWWEADHIVPVVEGGGECDLDGLQTLCRHCHLLASRALAGRRALAARTIRPQAVPTRVRTVRQQLALPLDGGAGV